MCIDMQIEVGMELRIALRADMCVQRHGYRHGHDMDMDMDICICMCADMDMDTCIDTSRYLLCRHVPGHLCRHALRHMCTHVFGNEYTYGQVHVDLDQR